MSFALEYRRKLNARLSEEARRRKAEEGFVSLPAEPASDTRRNRRAVFLALVLAGAVLGVFNSGGLVQYAYGLSGSELGRGLVVLTERWHGLMRDNRATRVMEEIRGSVALARSSSWRDLVISLSLTPAEEAPSDDGPPGAVPARADQPVEPAVPEEPKTARPEGPVMRASADRLN